MNTSEQRPQHELLRIDEIASLFRVTNEAVRLWIREKRIPSVQIAQTVRVPRRFIDELLESASAR
jgi:excisionase family DNA binding protein